MLRAVGYRYGIATLCDMPYIMIRFWYRGHLELCAEEERQMRAAMSPPGGPR